MPASDKEYTYKELMAEIESGRLLIVFKLKVYDVTNWIKIHPGGILPLKYQLGRDATDHIIAIHSEEIIEKKLPTFCVGTFRITPDSSNIFNTPISMAYRELHEEIVKKGYYNTHYIWHFVYFLLILGFWLASIGLVSLMPSLPTWALIPVTILSGLFMALVNQQNILLVHDTAHLQVTHKRAFDTALAAFVGPFFTGISANWWKDRHSIHHIAMSDPRHDPVVQQVPMYCPSPRFFHSIHSTYFDKELKFDAFAHFCAKTQQYTYYIFYILIARVGVYLGSLRAFRIRKDKVHRTQMLYLPFEYMGIFMHFAWIGYLIWSMPSWPIRLLWMGVVNLSFFFIIVQMNISHSMLPIEDILPQESLAERVYRTTLDIDVPVWLDWLHAGVQHHAVHHLFPRVARHYWREMTANIIIPFAKRHGLPYNRATFTKGNGLIHKHLKEIADQAKLFTRVASHPEVLRAGL